MENPKQNTKEKEEKGIIIFGMQKNQKIFRPANWNVRLSQSVLIELKPNYCKFPPITHTHCSFGFSSLCMPIHWENVASIFVSEELKNHPHIYDFLIKFSQENELQIIQNIEYSQIF